MFVKVVVSEEVVVSMPGDRIDICTGTPNLFMRASRQAVTFCWPSTLLFRFDVSHVGASPKMPVAVRLYWGSPAPEASFTVIVAPCAEVSAHSTR